MTIVQFFDPRCQGKMEVGQINLAVEVRSGYREGRVSRHADVCCDFLPHGQSLEGLIDDSCMSFLGGRCGSTQKRAAIPRKSSVENIPNERRVTWMAVACLADATPATYDFRVISLFENIS